MRCIFCKKTDVSFNSIEHIIPESIGNLEHTLAKGIVCDICNNYFSREVEGPFINSEVLIDIRNKMKIASKRKRIPDEIKSDMLKMPDQRIVARFLCKVGLEVLTQRAITANVLNWEQEVIDKQALDELRNFARFNIYKGVWPFYYRTLHPVNAVFKDEKESFEILHEYDLLYTDRFELYLILSLFGVEFAINLGGATMDGYKKWLEENDFKSHLYIKKNT